MARVGVSLSAQGVSQYRELSRKLRETGRKDLRKALRTKIADAGKPVVEEVKAAVRDLQVTSHGGGTTQRRRYNVSRARSSKAADRAKRRAAGLRQTIASATRLQQTAKGIRIVVNSQRLPADQQTLPRRLDSAKGWRHPVFGNRNNWVSQKGAPYFASTIQKRAPAFRQAAIDAMDEIARELES